MTSSKPFLNINCLFQITADPADINILPEYGNDPRVVTNLIDGVNKTRDDIHMWLAPFTSGRNHFVYITFEHPTRIAMIRIWVSVDNECSKFRVVFFCRIIIRIVFIRRVERKMWKSL